MKNGHWTGESWNSFWSTGAPGFIMFDIKINKHNYYCFSFFLVKTLSSFFNLGSIAHPPPTCHLPSFIFFASSSSLHSWWECNFEQSVGVACSRTPQSSTRTFQQQHLTPTQQASSASWLDSTAATSSLAGSRLISPSMSWRGTLNHWPR